MHIITTNSFPDHRAAGRRQSGKEWLDDFLTAQMAEILRDSGASLDDIESVRAILRNEKYSELAVADLAARAAEAAKALPHAA